MHCSHPNLDPENIRRFKLIGHSHFGVQCSDCLRRVGRKLEPDELGMHPKDVKRAEIKRGRTGLGGNGNSKRQDFEKRFKDKSWRPLRARVLDRDDYTCRNCGEAATQAHHLTYERFWHERLDDLAASCGPCNLAEREQRISGFEPG